MTNKTNRLIAEFMGFEYVTVNYWGDSNETDWQKINAEWMDKVGMDSVGDYIVNIAEDKWQEWGDVAYHSSWEDLMPVIVKISKEPLIDAREYSDTCYPRTFGMPHSDGTFMFRFNAFTLHYGSTWIEAAYAAVVEFIEHFNSN